jgi:ligand-binding sensor domain-containing protein
MAQRIFVGTDSGLWVLEDETAAPVEAFAARAVTALAFDGRTLWALIEGSALWASDGEGWTQRATIDGLPATCVAPTRGGVLVGT